MSIRNYKKEISPGVFKDFYIVQVEAINEYTGKRVQRKREDIPSLPKARRLEHDLWTECKKTCPEKITFSTWGELKLAYLEDVENNVRSKDNPEGFSPQTVQNKRIRLNHLKWDKLKLDLIVPKKVRETLNDFETNGIHSRGVTVEIQKEIKAALSFAVDCGAISVNPLGSLKKRKSKVIRPRKRLTHAEVNIFIQEAWIRNHPYFLAWLIPVITGMRRSEVAGLKWTDFDLKVGNIRLERQVKPKEGEVPTLKDGEARTPPIPKSFIPLLTEAKKLSKGNEVIDLNSRDWVTGNQSKVTKEFCREIGVTEVTYHQLRASFITNGLLEGISPAVMKEIVGHSKLSTTDGYFRASGADLLGKTDSLGVDVPNDGKNNVRHLKVVDETLRNPS